jgi:iron complex transport system ATP-binding protein
LILDEPFSHLDTGMRTQLYGLLRKLARSTRCPAIVLATHHLEDVGDPFTHGILLEKGRPLRQGPKKQVLSSKLLSRLFGLRLKVRSFHGRFITVDDSGSQPVFFRKTGSQKK